MDDRDYAEEAYQSAAAAYEHAQELDHWHGQIVCCQWFVFCGVVATGLTPHPVLGQVPTCDRCHRFASGGADRAIMPGTLLTDATGDRYRVRSARFTTLTAGTAVWSLTSYVTTRYSVDSGGRKVRSEFRIFPHEIDRFKVVER